MSKLSNNLTLPNLSQEPNSPDDGDVVVFIQDNSIYTKDSLGNIVGPLRSGGSSYLVYTAIVNQVSDSEPEVLVLENTLGVDLVWSRERTGLYTAVGQGAFPINTSRVVVVGQSYLAGGFGTGLFSQNGSFAISYTIPDANTMSWETNQFNDNSASDGAFCGQYIEIRVYPEPAE